MTLVDAATAALALGVTGGTISRYGRAGLLTRYGPRNRYQYDVNEVRALARKWAAEDALALGQTCKGV